MKVVLIQLFTAYLSSLGFSMLFGLRRRFLLPAALGGLLCWLFGAPGDKNKDRGLLALRAFFSWLTPTLTLLLVLWLLPRYGLAAYIAVIYITEAVNFLLSGKRLWRCLKQRHSGISVISTFRP